MAWVWYHRPANWGRKLQQVSYWHNEVVNLLRTLIYLSQRERYHLPEVEVILDGDITTLATLYKIRHRVTSHAGDEGSGQDDSQHCVQWRRGLTVAPLPLALIPVAQVRRRGRGLSVRESLANRFLHYLSLYIVL